MTTGPIAVLGFGTMGSGIAQVCAQAGFDVLVLDTGEEELARGRERMAAFLAGAADRGKITETDKAETLARVSTTTDVAALAGADLVIEAAVEDAEVKRTLLAEVAAVVGERAIIATNTSALCVTELAAAVPAPGRVAGLHFFNPAPLMPLVEVVRALQSADGTVQALMEFAGRLGKEPIEVKDRPGFLVNRLLMPYLNHVVQSFDDGLATARDIDVAVELGLGHPLGPLALLDLIGLDVHEHATQSAYEDTRDTRFAPPPLVSRMVAAGRLGRKTNSGFRTPAEEEDR
ncbi:MAG: 3-hydroxybutyryl-CoA dehydrogenase [Streptosporangiales bacterium]|nr:3-hydroxybutyryl-CoA dehydrogenase [Streptosporangiales bacterium]